MFLVGLDVWNEIIRVEASLLLNDWRSECINSGCDFVRLNFKPYPRTLLAVGFVCPVCVLWRLGVR